MKPSGISRTHIYTDTLKKIIKWINLPGCPIFFWNYHSLFVRILWKCRFNIAFPSSTLSIVFFTFQFPTFNRNEQPICMYVYYTLLFKQSVTLTYHVLRCVALAILINEIMQIKLLTKIGKVAFVVEHSPRYSINQHDESR